MAHNRSTTSMRLVFSRKISTVEFSTLVQTRHLVSFRGQKRYLVLIFDQTALCLAIGFSKEEEEEEDRPSLLVSFFDKRPCTPWYRLSKASSSSSSSSFGKDRKEQNQGESQIWGLDSPKVGSDISCGSQSIDDIEAPWPIRISPTSI